MSPRSVQVMVFAKCECVPYSFFARESLAVSVSVLFLAKVISLPGVMMAESRTRS